MSSSDEVIGFTTTEEETSDDEPNLKEDDMGTAELYVSGLMNKRKGTITVPYPSRNIPLEDDFVMQNSYVNAFRFVRFDNVMAKCKLYREIKNIPTLSSKLTNSSYDTRKFEGLSVVLISPASVNRVFKNGTLTTTGNKSYKEAKISLRKVLRKLQVAGLKDIKFEHFEVCSMSVTIAMGDTLGFKCIEYLEKNEGRYIFKTQDRITSYNWTIGRFKCKISVYPKSFKIVLMGISNEDKLKEFCDYLIQEINK